MSAAASVELISELTQLLYREAALLDAGRYEEWLELLADDLVYVAPIRPERDAGSPMADAGNGSAMVAARHELSYLHEGIDMMRVRVAKIRTGLQQSERPPSRTVRLISNVQVDDECVPGEHPVHSAFLLYRHRRQREVEILAGHRHDRWRRIRDDDGRNRGWLLAEREVLFAANVLPTKSLSLFY